MKRCSQCCKTKPYEAFTKQKAGRDGYRASCRECCQTYNAQYRAANRERIKAYNDRYRDEHREEHNAKGREWHRRNRERTNENLRKWRKANPEKVRAMKKRWREKYPEKQRRYKQIEYERHRETVIARVRQWTKNNPDMRRAQVLKRRSLEKNAAGADYTTAQHIRWRIDLYGGKCYYCGAEADTIDHRIPLVRGGSHWPASLVPACRSCNSRKHDKTELEFRAAA